MAAAATSTPKIPATQTPHELSGRMAVAMCGSVGLAGNGGGSGKDGRGAAICGASLVSAGIGTVETTFGVVSTISVGCCGGTGGAGGGLSPGSARVTTGGGDCLAQRNRSLERPGLP